MVNQITNPQLSMFSKPNQYMWSGNSVESQPMVQLEPTRLPMYTGTDIGSVQVRNAIALINEDGRAISLMITLVNSGTRTANVSMQYESGGEKTTTTKSVNPGDVSTYGTSVDDTQIIILNPGVKLGALFPVYVQYGDHEGKQLLVPVMNADAHPEYKDLIPAEVER